MTFFDSFYDAEAEYWTPMFLQFEISSGFRWIVQTSFFPFGVQINLLVLPRQ